MKERPILFNGEMVKAILDGRKTQTRRMVKPQPLWVADPSVPFSTPDADPKGMIKSPFGAIGDRLWVRETWGLMAYHDTTDWCRDSINGLSEADCRERYVVEHSANWKLPNESAFWRPSIHMPRWASRITLEITGVRVERLQDISDFDAFQEGSPSAAGTITGPYCMSFKQGFRDLWQSIYGNWDANPWVWVYEFRKI
jgi:hypothetical protein